MDINDFKYYTTINGLKGYANEKDYLVGEMVRDYDIAHDNLITRFSVIKNTKDGKDIFINFSDIPVRGVIGTKKSNGATSDMQEVIQIDPNLIKRGDYINFKYNDTDTLHTYIITSRIEKKTGYDEGVFLICNNTLNAKGWTTPIHGYFTNSSYGVKGVLDSEFMSSIDGQLLCYVQDNEVTNKIRLDMRFIFDNDTNQVYKVIKRETVATGVGKLRQIVLKKDTVMSDKDDFINNIAYNAFLDDEIINPQPEPTETNNIVSTSGALSIKMYYSNTFKVVDSLGVDSTDPWIIDVDQTGLIAGHITIGTITSNSIKITNNKGWSDIPVKLKFTSGTNVLECSVGLVVN